MAADAFAGTMLFKEVIRNQKGQVIGYGRTDIQPFTADDVAGNKLTFTKTNTTEYRPPFECDLLDIVVTEDGADTTRGELYVDGNQTSYSWLWPLLLGTNQQRVHAAAAPRIAARASCQFFQRA